MEVSSAAITGAMRVGVQVVVARKRPMLEIYQTLRNQFGPPMEIPASNVHGTKIPASSHRFQDIFIDLHMVNIGGDRAENVTFEVSGDFKREKPRNKMPELFSSTMRQVAPGQVAFLMMIEDHDLNTYAPDEHGGFKASGMKSETMTITINYDGPDTFFNRVLRAWRRWRGMKQYSTAFTFDPATVLGDLPHPTYHG